MLNVYQLIVVSMIAIYSSVGAQPMTNSSPESDFVNGQWGLGLAAGNNGDWYINCDGNHSNFSSSHFGELNRYPDGSAYGYQTLVRDAPRNVLGNASLGINGLWGMTRSNMPSSTSLNHLQYRANQHYFYPGVRDAGLGFQTRDFTYGMHPYTTQSLGSSGSESDEIRKFFLGMAAFRPNVKAVLEAEGLLIPTLQMIWRRTRVGSDSDYLSGLAHPSVFGDVKNDYEMVVMANEITADKIPPLVEMTVVDENFKSRSPTQFNDRYPRTTGEVVFTTPQAIGRLWRGPEFTKRMIIDVSNSIDINDLNLTYEFVLLRGDSSKVRMTPLNLEGTLMEIEMDYFTSTISPFTGEESNMMVIGVFAHNGHYYSSPAFVTCSTFWNESRRYRANESLQEISFRDEAINFNISFKRDWKRDIYEQDAHGRVFRYQREFNDTVQEYSAEGYLILEEDPGRLPTKVTEVDYSANDQGKTIAEAARLPADWDYEIDMAYSSEAIRLGGDFTHMAETFRRTYSVLREPRHGEVTTVGGLFPGYTYTPDAGFSGLDVFVVEEVNLNLPRKTILHKTTMVVGPEDTEAPQQVQNLQATTQGAETVGLTWNQVSDNYEVARFLVYRDGIFRGHSYQLSYSDEVPPGQQYAYTVFAEDHAGNLGDSSESVTGGSVILGQDDFNDSDAFSMDPGLENGLSWTLLSGRLSSSSFLKPGINSVEPTLVVTNQSIAPPFLMDFTNQQAYNTNENGPVFLFQDVDNFYHLTINRGTCSLYRRMDGVDILIGSNDDAKMQHASSVARFQVAVVATGGVITFRVVRRDWTVLPGLATEVFFVDSNPAAAARFSSGPVGFKQLNLQTYNVATFDKLTLTRYAENDGPDLDRDGLVDAWERAHFGDPSSSNALPASDPDGDGFSTIEEQLLGTAPLDGDSFFQSSIGPGSSSEVEFSWPSLHGRSYTVWASTDLNTWEEVPGMIDLSPTPPKNVIQLNSPVGEDLYLRLEIGDF